MRSIIAKRTRPGVRLMRRALLLALLVLAPAAVSAQTADPPLALETKIPLGAVHGRIDHLDVDVKRRRILVAELGNNSLGVVDLVQGKSATVGGFREPQGVSYEPSSDTVYVANAGDGSLRLLNAGDLAETARIELGADADNVRIDTARRRVVVGYGGGGLAIIDAARRARAADIRLAAHPESFQLAAGGTLAFINIPDAQQIAIADLAGRSLRAVPTAGLRENYPMAIDEAAGRVLVGFRSPPTLAAFAMTNGRLLGRLPICGDADDLFVDAKRRRVYVSCGAGFVDILQPAGEGYERLARVPTAPGARTALFVPELDRLYVAARPGWTEPASLWVFRPRP